MPISRRSALMLAGASLASSLRLSADDPGFWNRKLPRDWTPSEIDQLLHNSPWARQIVPVYVGGSPNDRPWSEIPPGVRIPPDGREARVEHAPYRATVRWDSARPITDAMRTPLPRAFTGLYVIEVTGEISPRDLGKNPLEDLRQRSVLMGQRPVLAERRNEFSDDFLVGFRKIALDTRQSIVEFYTRVGRLELTARFNLRDMRYHGILAV